jgi:uncharacterized membrane protein YeaQ/YmgE (transglycosylase-associated protein family)
MMKNSANKDDTKIAIAQIGKYLGLGLQLAVTVVAPLLAGDWIDKHYNTGTLWTIICGVVGCVVGLYDFISQVLNSEKKTKK